MWSSLMAAAAAVQMVKLSTLVRFSKIKHNCHLIQLQTARAFCMIKYSKHA